MNFDKYRPEATSDVISGSFSSPIVPDMCMKFRNHRLSRSREIQPEAVGCGIINGFSRDNFRWEVISDVQSGVIQGQTVLEIFESLSF